MARLYFVRYMRAVYVLASRHELSCRIVLPIMMVCLIRSAATRTYSSVPALAWHIVTESPPSLVRRSV